MNSAPAKGKFNLKEILGKKALHLTIIIAIVGVLVTLFFHIKNSVNEQLVRTELERESPAEILNHANTLYWLGRTYGNTTYEFEKSEKLALLVKEMLAGKNDSISTLTRIKADKIISNSKHNREQNALTVNNKYPYFLDFAGLNELPEEDQPLEEMDRVTTIRVLTKLLDLPEQNSSRPLRDYPYFSILVHNTNDAQLHEAGIQYLNLTTKQYTISEHEIAQITGVKNFKVEQILKDTINVRKICDFFNCSELAIINVNKQDQYDGIYYYGANIRLISPNSNEVKVSRYTEAFTAARGYNTMLGIKIPLLISYLLLLILGVELLSLLNLFAYSRIKWHRFILVGFISMVINIVSIEALAYFWNPASGEFAETDKAMVWIFAVALIFTLIPILVGHLTVGKLDRFISSFDSGLDDKNGLFSVIFPGLTVYSISITYYNLLRFGISDDLYFALYAFVYAVVISYLMSYYWKKVKELPSKSFLFHQISVYTLFGIIVLCAILFPYSTFGNLDPSNTLNAFILFVCIPLFLSLMNEIILKVYFSKHTSSELQKTIDIDNIHYVPSLFEDEMRGNLKDQGVLVLYGAKKMGKTWLAKKIAERLLKENTYDNLVYIDLSLAQSEEEKNKINYYPFAEGFSHLLPKNVFNDQAEEARKSGNILGKLISSITSAGDFLVDESESKPAELTKIRKIITDKISEHPRTLIVFDNIHVAQGDNKELFLSFVNEIHRINVENKQDSEQKKYPLLLFTSTQGFHFKREFENIIEGLINARNSKQNATFKLEDKILALSQEENCPPFYTITSDPQYLNKYLNTFTIGIFDRKIILEKFKKSEKDKAPGLVAEILKSLDDLQQLSIKDKTIKVRHHDFEIPDIVEELDFFEQIVKSLSPELIDILRCCAYAAMDDGEFEVEAISFILEKKRLDILHHLNIAENLNIVYDTKDKNDWYRFNDVRFIMVLKKQDSQGINQLFSQLGKEYYLRWVNYYFEHFEDLKKDVVNHRQTLVSLAERSFLLNEIQPEKSLMILKKMGYFFLEPQISLLENAKQSFVNAISIMSRKNSTSLNAEIYEIQVKGLLRTLDEKNELNGAEANEILAKKQEIIDCCPELAFDLYYTEKLAFAKSTAFHPDVATNYITEINTKLAKEKLDDVSEFKLRFLALILEPMGGAKFDKLQQLCISYEALISRIQDSNQIDVYLSGGIYQQLLNNYGGNIIGDKMIGHNDLKDNPEARLELFLKSIRILALRVRIELDRFIKNAQNEQLVEGLQKIKSIQETKEINSFEDALLIIRQIVDVLNYKSITYFVDRKGLSYTVNYLTRSLYYYCIDNNELRVSSSELKSIIEDLSDYAYSLNSDVQDSMGIIMSSSFKGLIKQNFNPSKDTKQINEAFGCFEESFAQAFSTQFYQSIQALNNMANLVAGLEGNTSSKLATKLKSNRNLFAQRHLLNHFDKVDLDQNGSTAKLEEDNVIENKADLSKLTKEPGSKFHKSAFKDPQAVIDFIEDLVKNQPSLFVKENGKAYLQITLDFVVGTNNVIAIDELPEGVEVKTGKRRDFNDAKLVSGIPYPETKCFSAVLSKDLDYIETAHPGPISPQFPSTKQPLEIQKANSDYWNKHAFIINE
jgi:hypothetical protein